MCLFPRYASTCRQFHNVQRAVLHLIISGISSQILIESLATVPTAGHFPTSGCCRCLWHEYSKCPRSWSSVTWGWCSATRCTVCWQICAHAPARPTAHRPPCSAEDGKTPRVRGACEHHRARGTTGCRWRRSPTRRRWRPKCIGGCLPPAQLEHEDAHAAAAEQVAYDFASTVFPKR